MMSSLQTHLSSSHTYFKHDANYQYISMLPASFTCPTAV